MHLIASLEKYNVYSNKLIYNLNIRHSCPFQYCNHLERFVNDICRNMYQGENMLLKNVLFLTL